MPVYFVYFETLAPMKILMMQQGKTDQNNMSSALPPIDHQQYQQQRARRDLSRHAAGKTKFASLCIKRVCTRISDRVGAIFL